MKNMNRKTILLVFGFLSVFGIPLIAQENPAPRGSLRNRRTNNVELFQNSQTEGTEENVIIPTTMQEILQALQPPSVRPRDILGIRDDLDEEFLTYATKVAAMVQFEYNSADIKPDSLPLLQEYGKAFQVLKDAMIVIAGHTDEIGSDEFNLRLSGQRAESIRQYLVKEFQLSEKRLLIKPFGEGKPIATNKTADGRAKNRRVEFYRLN